MAKRQCGNVLHCASLAVSSMLLSMMMSLAVSGEAIAQTPQQQTTPRQSAPQQATPAQSPPQTTAPNAPPELAQTLAQIDAAASQADLGDVMNFYSRNFRNSDGLTYQTLRSALESFWQRYPNLTYRTALNSWQADGNALVAETTTTITGTNQNNERPLRLNASIQSRQRFENGRIVEQTILDERSEITTGTNPPDVDINLPDQVRPGQEFNFDAIVTEPLGDRLLLGSAVEEAVRPRGYVAPAPIELEPLSAGGLFKVGQAPARPGDRWISAVLIRDDGISIVTNRLHVTGQPVSSPPSNNTSPSDNRPQ